MKSQPGLHERLDSAIYANHTAGWREVAGNQLEERCLPRAVPPHDSETLTLLHLQIDAVQRRIGGVPRSSPESEPADAKHIERLFLDAGVQTIGLRNVGQGDRERLTHSRRTPSWRVERHRSQRRSSKARVPP